MKIKEIINNYKKYILSKDHKEEYLDIIIETNNKILECLKLLNIIVEHNIDIYSEFILNEPKDYEEYQLYHNYKYSIKTLLLPNEFTYVKEVLKNLK